MRVASRPGLCLLAVLPFLATAPAAAAAEATAREAADTTLVVGLSVDRAGAGLVAHTRKSRPYQRRRDLAPARATLPGGPVQLEVVLGAADGRTFVERVELDGLCLEHPPLDPPHVQGDTIRVHHDTFVVELPAIAGFDRLEVATYTASLGTEAAPAARLPLGTFELAPERLLVTEGGAEPFAPAAPAAPTGGVHWPEEYGETERYRVWGSEAEVAQRINVVLVPDGYTHAQKALMEQHAASVVDHFRQKTPFGEHDPFFNYTLVYAYSNEDATDQCDCGILRDTAMNTRFPNDGYPCGHSGNRCLYYGYGCDPANDTDANITAAELRAPAKDVTLVMVNTTRYGGCGGSRAVYAAGNGSAAEIAVHELGHSLAGLADEYESSPACGTWAGEINTSMNATDGAWPEWIAELGAPVQGAQYYSKCVYRPVYNCEMRALNSAFCAVCNQRWSLRVFGHARVAPTAPVSSSSPESPVDVQVGRSVTFSVGTRLSTGSVANSITWQARGPSDPAPVTVATGSTSLARSFVPEGTHTLTCEVVADTNFVKPSRTGANRDLVSWTVNASAIPEVSGAARPLTVARRADGRLDLTFEDVGAAHANVYVSNAPGTHPFQVTSSAQGKKDCAIATTAAGTGLLKVSGYDPDAGLTGDRRMLFLLVTADNGAGTESSLGPDSAAVERGADSRCAR